MHCFSSLPLLYFIIATNISFSPSLMLTALYAASNARTGNTNSITGWGAGAPWMYVAGGGDACFLEEYRTPVSLFDQMMRYVVGKYTLNGTFAGYDEIGTLFTYCSRPLAFSGYGGGEGSSTGWQYYGASETQNYQCDLSTLLDKDQYFYELFLYDPKTDDTENNLLPVPVRVVGVTLDGGSTTSNTLSPELLCDGDDVLVRRFFLYDIVSGFSSTSGDTPDVIRYAQNITIEMALSETYRVISNPVLTIQFGEALPSEFPAAESTNDDLEIADTGANTQVVEYTFNAIYSMDMDTFDRQLYRWGIASAVFCGLYFLFRLNNWWLRMNRGTSPDSVETGSAVTGAFESVLLCASSYVYFFFSITTLVCWYFIAFYKLQSVPAAMLPTVINEYVKGSNYYAFTTTLQSMFFLHLFYCLVLIYRQCNADVFFLDWEPAVSNKNSNGKVSVWRSIFVANEWSEMQTMRKIDPHFTLFWLVFFLIGLGQENVATMQPNVGNLAANNSPINPWLRFGNTVFWWLVLSAAQWLWKFLVYERFFSETKETWFIDFATLAKISIFCFDEPFHGYYLHCRSPYQHADGTMADLQQMLERETQGMTTDRSLDSNFPDVQAFQCFFTGEFRTAFSRIYNTMVIAGAGGNDGGAARRRGMEGAGAGAPLNADKQLRAWKELTVFLQEFVENNFKKVTLRRTIREPSLFEEVTEYPADLSRNFEEPNVFLPDRHHRYTRCMFLGREWELLIMNILAFATFDLWLSSTAYAALLTYLLDFLFCFIRKEYGQAVITNKSLIDSRFLS
jgi:meckelin